MIRRLVGGPKPGSIAGALWIVGSLVTPTAIRALLAPLTGQGVPFAAFYPAVLVSSLAAGWRIGMAVTLGSAVIANYLFMPPFGAVALDVATVTATAVFLLTAAMIIVVAGSLRRTVHELDEAAKMEASLREELAHRVKNNLAIVQGLAQQTVRTTRSPEAFYEALSARLAALGQAHNVLSTGDWGDCDVGNLVEEALGPFQSEGSIAFRGERCTVPPRSCVPLVLVLHELATNAVKYGALSTPAGRVDVTWFVAPDQRLFLGWQESQGPVVQAPTRRGLGTRLLSPQTGLNDVRLRFDPDGVRCEVEIEGAKLRPNS